VVLHGHLIATDSPGVSWAATGLYHTQLGNVGTPTPRHPPWRDTKMPVCGREGGGGVVAKRRAVMARTG